MNREPITFPAISLVVSGGHTELYLMKDEKNLQWLGGTLDDAAGEAFDKIARLLGFENKGGPAIQEAAHNFIKRHPEFISGSQKMLKQVQHDNLRLPRPMLNDATLNFSFSGLKTAVLREANRLKTNQQFNNSTIEQLAYETQEAITDVLVIKTLRAAEKFNAKSILLSGGVAANLRLREKFNFKFQISNFKFFFPPISLCTDNAVYIGSCAYFRGKPRPWQRINAEPDLSVEFIS